MLPGQLPNKTRFLGARLRLFAVLQPEFGHFKAIALVCLDPT
jgi:hypothetical protein